MPNCVFEADHLVLWVPCQLFLPSGTVLPWQRKSNCCIQSSWFMSPPQHLKLCAGWRQRALGALMDCWVWWCLYMVPCTSGVCLISRSICSEWLNHLQITGQLGLRFGSISGERWAGRFCGSVGQPQLLFSATWHSHFMPLTGEHMWCQKAREAYVDDGKTEPYGSQCADHQRCQW